jgi:N-acetylglucosaminyl-diphospho-decaprenol L-rhamnosyltransferase
LNPDTEVRSGAVAALVRFLEAHPEAAVAGPSFETRDGRDWSVAFRFPTLLGELEQGLKLGLATRLLERWAVVRRMGERSETVDWVSGSAMMIRPAAFASVGGMDENYFLFFEETDLCRRMRAAGFTICYVPESRVMHIGGVTTDIRKRRPPYWFDSRRRYFALSFGVAHAMLIDIVAVGAHLLGALKRLLQGRPQSGTPRFVRDLIHHSIIWRRNRSIAPMRSRALIAGCAAKPGEAVAQPRT